MMESERPPSDPAASPFEERLEERLRAERLLPAPPDLAARVMLGLPSQTQGVRLSGILRFAAAVLAVLGAWVFATGALPSVAAAAPAPLLEHAVAPMRTLLPDGLGRSLTPLASATVGDAGGSPLLAAGAGALLLAGGLLVAWRLLQGPRRKGTS